MALSWLNLPRALKAAIVNGKRHWAALSTLPRHRGRSKTSAYLIPNGGVADSLDEAKAAFRRGGVPLALGGAE
jgi:hypothetical protein